MHTLQKALLETDSDEGVSEVIDWIPGKNFGFLANPDDIEGEDIFVHINDQRLWSGSGFDHMVQVNIRPDIGSKVHYIRNRSASQLRVTVWGVVGK